MMAAVDGRGEDINKVISDYIATNASAVDALINAARAK